MALLPYNYLHGGYGGYGYGGYGYGYGYGYPGYYAGGGRGKVETRPWKLAKIHQQAYGSGYGYGPYGYWY